MGGIENWFQQSDLEAGAAFGLGYLRPKRPGRLKSTVHMHHQVRRTWAIVPFKVVVASTDNGSDRQRTKIVNVQPALLKKHRKGNVSQGV